MIKRDLFVAVGLVLVVLPITQQEELMGWFLEGHKFISFFYNCNVFTLFK